MTDSCLSVTVSLCLRDFSKKLRYIFNFVKRQTQDQAAVCIIFKIIVGEVHGGRQSNPGRHGKIESGGAEESNDDQHTRCICNMRLTQSNVQVAEMSSANIHVHLITVIQC